MQEEAGGAGFVQPKDKVNSDPTAFFQDVILPCRKD